MQEVLLYGITKEPIFCLHGDELQVYEHRSKSYPCADGAMQAALGKADI